MSDFLVKPIEPSISEQVRQSLRSPEYGHPALSETATGYGPCRSCLNVFRAGEERRLLFTYNAFTGLDSYPSPGPVFIHESSCSPYDQTSTFPPALRALPLTFEGYGSGRWLIARERPTDAEIEPAIQRLLANPAVQYIHIRNTEAGCYIARIDRSPQTLRYNTHCESG
jgi:Protein of unknown function (DUF1203)